MTQHNLKPTRRASVLISQALDVDITSRFAAIALSQLLEGRRAKVLRLPPGMLNGPATPEVIHTVFADLDQVQLQRLTAQMSSAWFVEQKFTLLGLLNSDAPQQPSIPVDVLTRLISLGESTEVVPRQQVRHVLEQSSMTEDEVEAAAEYLMPNEVAEVIGFVLGELCRKLTEPHRKHHFASKFVDDIVDVRRRMLLLIPHLVLAIVTIVLVSSLPVESLYQAGLSASPPSQPWSNMCRGGQLTDDGACTFHYRDLSTVQTQMQATETVYEMVTKLWQYANETSNAAGDFETSWLVGAMHYRASFSGDVAGGNETFSCEFLNSSMPVVEHLMPASFKCDAHTFIPFPFSMTKTEALDQASLPAFGWGITQFSVYSWGENALILQFPMYNPNNGVYIWVTVSLASSLYGGIVQRLTVIPFDRSLHNPVIILASLHMVKALLLLVIIVATWKHGRVASLVMSMVLEMIHLGLIIASLVLVLQIGYPKTEELLQTEYIPRGFDHAAHTYMMVRRIMSLWVLLTMLTLFRYFKHLPIVKLVYRLVALMLPELLGQCILFILGYLTFVLVAVVVFGSTSTGFSTIGRANALMFGVIMGGSIEEILINFPVAGLAFVLLYRAYILFLVVNFLTIIVLLPIGQVRNELSLLYATMDATTAARRTTLGKMSSYVSRCFTYVVDLLSASCGFRVHYWLKVSTAMRLLYGSSDAREQLEGVTLVLDATVEDKAPFKGNLFATVSRLPLRKCEASFALCKLFVMHETEWEVRRDALLWDVVTTYGTNHSSLSKVVSAESEEDDLFSANDVVPAELVDDQAAQTMARVDAIRCADGREVSYHFTQHVVDQLRGSYLALPRVGILLSGLERLAIVVGFILVVVTIATSTRYVSYLNQNAHRGLRQSFMRQSCADANCTSVDDFTRGVTFDQVGDLNDLRDFLRRGYSRLFTYVGTPGYMLTNTTWYVDWDNDLLATDLIVMRQLRGAPRACATDAPVGSPRWRKSCFATDEFDTAPFSPADPSSQLPSSAFTYRPWCAERSQTIRSPYGYNLPCAGYSLEIANFAQLMDASENWLDNATRVLALTVVLGLDPSSAFPINLEYNMYVQMGYGGAAARVWTYAEPLDDPVLDDMKRRALIGVLLASAASVFAWFVRNVSNIVYGFGIARHELVPSANAVLAAVFFVLMAIRPSFAVNASAVTVAVLKLSMSVGFMVLLPLAQFFFRRATGLVLFLSMALVHMAGLVPLFLLVLTAFGLSGYLQFGSWLFEYSSMTNAFITICTGFLGEFDFKTLYENEPHFTFVYAGAFLFTILLVCLNILLAFIGGAAEEANESTALIEEIEELTRIEDRWIFFGPLARNIARLYLAREGASIADTSEPLFAWDEGRLPLMEENLTKHVTPHVAAEVLREIRYRTLPSWIKPSVLAVVLGEVDQFRRQYPHKYFEDLDTADDQKIRAERCNDAEPFNA